MPPVTATHVVPDEVAQYCAAHQLSAALETALRLAEETFAPVRRLEVTLEPDPEVNAEYVVLDVWPGLSAAEAFSRKQRYTHQWVRSVPPSVVGRIRLMLHPL
jgi:hypothetical protein